MISALVSAGLEGGYMANPRLAKVHWQAGDRPLPAARVSVAGESALWVDPAEIPAGSDIGKLGGALAEGRHGERDELMASTAAYSGLRWGELTALGIHQVDTGSRVITMDRKVVEVAGHLYVEAPKCRKYRRTRPTWPLPAWSPTAPPRGDHQSDSPPGQHAPTSIAHHVVRPKLRAPADAYTCSDLGKR
jgi:integrase